MCPPLRAQRSVSALRQAETAVSDRRLRRPTRDDRSIVTSAEFFRIDDGLAAEHRGTVDYVRRYQSFGLLPDDIDDV